MINSNTYAQLFVGTKTSLKLVVLKMYWKLCRLINEKTQKAIINNLNK